LRSISRFSAVLILLLLMIFADLIVVAVSPDGVLVLGTWNVRGYPEKTAEREEWLSNTLLSMGLDIVCIQEIGNQADSDAFLAKEKGFDIAAFENSSDKMDNAIFFAGGIQIVDVPDPHGFQHPAQAAYFRYRGFDAMLITVHLSWSDRARREKERELLPEIVQRALQVDPDVIIAGDFNTTERSGDEISSLAESLGLQVLVADNTSIGTTYSGASYDFILVSPDLVEEETIGSSHIVEPSEEALNLAKSVSDHRPVIAQFRTDEEYADCKGWPPRALLSFSWDTTATAAADEPACVSCLAALNAASYGAFKAVDGIGDVLAQRLVDGQPYASTSALDDIRGIGPVKMEAILDALCSGQP